jgi:RHS repeat-associated protein
MSNSNEFFSTVCSIFDKGYRYGFNGQEQDDEVNGDGKIYTAEYWEYDCRLGRRLNLDPLDQVWMSNYSVLANNPLTMIDPKGNKPTSRHLDPNGKIIAEYDDGDDNVYKHQTARTKEDVDKWREKFKNTSGNGVRVGTMNMVATSGIFAKSTMGQYLNNNSPKQSSQTSSYKQSIKNSKNTNKNNKFIGDDWEGHDNPTNQEKGPGGPDAAGVGFGLDFVCGVGGGGEVALIGSDDGTHLYGTARSAVGVVNMGVKLSYGPSLQLYWLSDFAKSKGYTASSQLTGESVYFSAGSVIGGTLIQVIDAEGNILMWGISIQGTTGFATGTQVTK